MLPDLIPMFIKSAVSSNWLDNSKEVIARTIAQLDPRHDQLRSLLHHKDYKVRRNAAFTITALGHFNPGSHPQQTGSVRLNDDTDFEADDKNETESSKFKWRLPKDSEAIPVLIETLQDRTELGTEITFADVVLMLLASFGPEARPAVSTVKQMLADHHATTRRIAVKPLAEIGPAAKETIPSIRAALNDTNADVRAAAAKSLGKFADRDSLPALKTLMKDKDPEVRQSVVEAFSHLKEDAKTTVPILVEVLKTPPSKLKTTLRIGDRTETGDDYSEIAVVGEAFNALGRLGPAAQAAVPELLRQARLPENRFAQSAYRALRKVSPEDAAKISPPKG